MYVELYTEYASWLYSSIDKFYSAGYNQGQLHKLKVMMRGLDIVDARNEPLDTTPSIDLPISLLSLNQTECQYLYTELTRDGHFLPKNTNQANFNYVFGGGVCPSILLHYIGIEASKLSES